MAFSNILMKVNTRILLFLIYFLLLGPISLIMKIIGNDPINRFPDKKQESYFITREKNSFDIDKYKRQF